MPVYVQEEHNSESEENKNYVKLAALLRRILMSGVRRVTFFPFLAPRPRAVPSAQGSEIHRTLGRGQKSEHALARRVLARSLFRPCLACFPAKALGRYLLLALQLVLGLLEKGLWPPNPLKLRRPHAVPCMSPSYLAT